MEDNSPLLAPLDVTDETALRVLLTKLISLVNNQQKQIKELQADAAKIKGS